VEAEQQIIEWASVIKEAKVHRGNSNQEASKHMQRQRPHILTRFANYWKITMQKEKTIV
jgi:hypothetical protein